MGKRRKIKVNKIKFAEAVLKEGIGLNPNYNYVVCEWPWVKEFLADSYTTINALETKNRSFNLYINEKYGTQEINDIVNSILKVEEFLKSNVMY